MSSTPPSNSGNNDNNNQAHLPMQEHDNHDETNQNKASTVHDSAQASSSPNYEQQPSTSSQRTHQSLTVPSNIILTPDSLDRVEEEAEPIFNAFVQERLMLDQERRRVPPSHLVSPQPRPSASSSSSRRNNQNLRGFEQAIAHRLVELGDAIEEEHSNVYDAIIQYLNPTPDHMSAYFNGVAKALFSGGGQTNWAHVVTLFYLGYRMGLECLRNGISDFLENLTSNFMRILRSYGVSAWVAINGGWRTILLLVRDFVSDTPRFVMSAVIISSALLAAWMIGRRMT